MFQVKTRVLSLDLNCPLTKENVDRQNSSKLKYTDTCNLVVQQEKYYKTIVNLNFTR